MNEKDKLLLLLEKSVEYLECVANALRGRREDKDLVHEIDEVTFHLREFLHLECKKQTWDINRFAEWFDKALRIMLFLVRLHENIDKFRSNIDPLVKKLLGLFRYKL